MTACVGTSRILLVARRTMRGREGISSRPIRPEPRDLCGTRVLGEALHGQQLVIDDPAASAALVEASAS